jgi:hypothetical protein
MKIKEEDLLIKPQLLQDLLLWAFFINLFFSVCLLFEISWVSKLLTFIIVNAILLYWKGLISWEAYLTKTHYYKKKHFSEQIACIPYEKFSEVHIGTLHVHKQGRFHIIKIYFKNEQGKKEFVQFLFNKKINYNDNSLVFNKCRNHFMENMNIYQYKLFFEKDKKWVLVNPKPIV